MDRHSHPEPRMPMIKQFSENGPVGVLKPCCTTVAGPTRALTARHPIKLTSPRCHSAWQPNPGRGSTYRRGNFVQITGTTSIEGDDLKKRKWILADGRDVTGTEYARKTGARPIPDLRGMFLRGIDPASNRSPGSKEQFATALPSTKAFVGTTSSAGEHEHGNGATYTPSGDRYNVGARDYIAVNVTNTAKAVAHTHTVKINDGA